MNLWIVEEAVRKVIAIEYEELVRAARAVVNARHYGGDDGWDKLKNAIGELEDIVGRPE